jgi:hypothetical protein
MYGNCDIFSSNRRCSGFGGGSGDFPVCHHAIKLRDQILLRARGEYIDVLWYAR